MCRSGSRSSRRPRKSKIAAFACCRSSEGMGWTTRSTRDRRGGWMAITGRALPLPLHERQGSPRATGDGGGGRGEEGDTAGQECRALDKAVAYTYTLTHIHTSIHVHACVQSVLHRLAVHATTQRTPHAAQHTLRLSCPVPPTPSSPPSHHRDRERQRAHSPLACRPVIYIHLMYTLLLTGPMI